MYNQETINVQYLNQSFVDKIQDPMTKQAGENAMSAFVRQKLREDGFTRKILNPIQITNADLDRQLTDEPTIIVEKEPDSVAANFSFTGAPIPRYYKAARYPVTMQKISSPTFTKAAAELATYRTDIRTVLQENSVKDLQKQEDGNFYGNCVTMATAAGNVHNIGGGLTVPSLMTATKYLMQNQLPVSVILMTQSLYADLMKQPATQFGSQLASELTRGVANLDNFFGFRIVTTNKNDILPDNRAMIFTAPEYLGQFYVLKDATVFIKTEMDMIEFTSYSQSGIGIGNTNGVIIADF
jgi:hypothetical protein